MSMVAGQPEIAETVTRLSDSAIIDAGPELIWKTLRDFSTIARWHPVVQDCIIEGDGLADRVGAVRAIHLRDGTPLRERVTALSEKNMSYSYSVIESPWPLEYHSSTVSLMAVAGGTKTLVTWYVEFRLKQGDPEQMANGIHSGVLLPGFQGLAKLAADNL
jgi:Polyketide cyclase / dehydrase and lipid transport